MKTEKPSGASGLIAGIVDPGTLAVSTSTTEQQPTKLEAQTTLGPAQWSGAATEPNQPVPAGQTAAAYLGAKTFARKNHETLGAAFRELLEAWPKDTAPGVTPAAFGEKASALDDYKASLLESVLGTKNTTLAQQLVADANVMHGKAGHTENVKAFVYALLARPEVSARLGVEGPSARFEAGHRLEQAATWLNLCDLVTPAAVLCAPRRLTDAEVAEHVKPCPERSAALLEKLDLAGPEVVSLVREHRGGGDRPLFAQLLDLADQAAAMAAKPFFQKEGKVDAHKLGGALRGNAEKAGLDAALIDAVVGSLAGGLADAALTKARETDLWHR